MNPTFSLLFGGMSFEHEISIISAITIKNILKNHIKHFIFLDSSHHFYLIPSELMRADFFAQKGVKNPFGLRPNCFRNIMANQQDRRGAT